MRSAENFYSLGNSEQTEAFFLFAIDRAVRRKTFAVVFDIYVQKLFVFSDLDLYFARIGVFENIVQTFLHDAVNADLLFARKNIVDVFDLGFDLQITVFGGFVKERL